MSIPKVSVIIPTYNRANSVGRAIDSVLRQTFKDYEVIVVDDGSTDDSVTLLAGFGRQIHLIRQQNAGVSAARNAGIRAARGQWIAFLDSDDVWMPEKLDLQIECLERSGAKVCFTRCMAENKQLIPDVEALKPAGSKKEIFFSDPVEMIWRLQGHPQIQSMMADRQLLLRAGMFDESLHAAEDTKLIFNLAFLAGFMYLEEPLVMIYRWSPHSLTYNLKPEAAAKRYSSYLRVQAEAYWRLVDVLPERSGVLREKLSYFISRRAELALAAGQVREARSIAQNAFRMGGNLDTMIRCLGIYFVPFLLYPRLRKKWHGNKSQDVVAAKKINVTTV